MQPKDPEEEELDEEDRIPLFAEEADYEAPDLGPDERDLDLMDGSWEQDYYSGRQRSRDWGTISKALGILVLLGLLVPLFLTVFN